MQNKVINWLLISLIFFCCIKSLDILYTEMKLGEARKNIRVMWT
uniref:Uncharacterized protein n=1 Tax=Arundo donax TaxID=35708 RepID=A0A0A9HL01_ARUDO